MLLIINGLQTAISQRTLIPKLLTVCDTTFCHVSGTLELSLICSLLFPYSQSVSKLFSPFDIVFHIYPSAHFYYYEEFFLASLVLIFSPPKQTY